MCYVIFGIWIGENETAKFRLSVLTDLKNRGVKDILIICSDGLSGIKQAIESAFPNTVQQRCIVHLIRNSCKYLSYKDRKEFCKDLRTVFPTDESLFKSLYLAQDKITSKWNVPYGNWGIIYSSLQIIFEGRG